ncbi:hypothetical protein EVAR_21677_1 [Eumeta japonica]|uniref:Uncharacterized protein n=1 Tax=Eumeta variegata TaxID=151549 RepID=A0A4C1VIV1_EUMVA|nr:hypothetical protein EVAR_21677_1 [Eumeta japonica]
MSGIQLAIFADDTALYFCTTHQNQFSSTFRGPLISWVDGYLPGGPRDLELPTTAKFMKDVSKRFFDIAESHSNALFCSAAFYQPPRPYHFIRRPWNVLTDPPDVLTAAVESNV